MCSLQFGCRRVSLLTNDLWLARYRPLHGLRAVHASSSELFVVHSGLVYCLSISTDRSVLLIFSFFISASSPSLSEPYFHQPPRRAKVCELSGVD